MTVNQGPRPLPAPSTIVLAFGGRIARADIPALCERVRLLLEGCDAELVVCDVGALVDPDAVTVDALARLQLTARRLGRRIRLHHACGELQELLALMGLGDVLQVGDPSALEPGGQAEQREQAGGVQEERDPVDPVG
jgi:ABC-type transporter Mla MlaB component